MEEPKTDKQAPVLRCSACKSEISPGASLCPVCKSHQRAWKNHLQYVAGIITLVALSCSAGFWLYDKIRSTSFYREDVAVVACCSSIIHKAVIVNRGDKSVFVSHIQLWMTGRTKDWISPDVEINQTLTPGQFFKQELPPGKFDSGDIIRGLDSADFERIVTKSVNNDPCFDLQFFAGFDTHFIDLEQMAGSSLNTFDVSGYLE